MLRSALFLSVFAIVLLAEVAQAQEKVDPATAARLIGPWMDEQTVAVARLDVERLVPDELVRRIRPFMLATPKAIEDEVAGSRVLREQFLKAGARDFYAVFNLDSNTSRIPLIVVPLHGTADAKQLERLIKELVPGEVRTAGNTVVATAAPERLKSLPRQGVIDRPELEQAFRAVADADAQLVILPTGDIRRVLEELVPKLPHDMGKLSTKELLGMFSWAAIGGSTSPNLSGQVVIKSPSADSAKSLKMWWERLLTETGGKADVKKYLPQYPQIAKMFVPALDDDRLVIKLGDKEREQLLELLTLPLQSAQQSATKMVSANNLKQLALVMYTHENLHKTFPPQASYDKNGRPLLSWRVHVLPYLNQVDADLYKQFHLDEPWDSEHNRKLIEKMPAVYRSPVSKAEAGRTVYQVPVGERTIFGGRRGMPMGRISDGTSRTIMILEVNDDLATPWTKPEDWKVDIERPFHGLGGLYSGKFYAAFADGSVHLLGTDRDSKLFIPVLTASAGDDASPFLGR